MENMEAHHEVTSEHEDFLKLAELKKAYEELNAKWELNMDAIPGIALKVQQESKEGKDPDWSEFDANKKERNELNRRISEILDEQRNIFARWYESRNK